MPLRRPLMGISEDLKAALCPKPCKGPITRSQRRLMPDGTVEVTGESPPPLCDACPERDNPKASIRHIEVLHGFPPGGNVWGVRDIENAVRIKLVYDDPPDGIRCRE
jgi:hypothetical protein